MNTKLLEVVIGLKDRMSAGMQKLGSRATALGQRIKATAFSMKGLVAAIAGLVIIRQAVRWMADAVKLAQEQEAAEISLTAALKAKNQYTVEGYMALRDYASAMQNAIGVGDEMTLQTMATIEAITGLSQEALPDAMRAVVQISELYGVKFKDAGILLAKTLSSTINAFSRYGIEVDTAASQTEKLAEIMEKTSAGWDMAIEKADTMEGATKILTCAWGDLKEEIGKVITQNPALVEILKLSTLKVGEVTDSVIENRGQWIRWSGDVMFSTARGSLALAKFVAGLGVVWSAIKMGAYQIWSWLNVGVSAFLKAIQWSVNKVIDGINKLLELAVAPINLLITATNRLFHASLPLVRALKVEHIDLGIAIADAQLAADRAAMAMRDSADTMRDYGDTIVALTDAQADLTEIQNRLNATTQELTGSSAGATGASNALADALDKTGGAAGGAADKVKQLTDNIGALTIASAKLPGMLPITGAAGGGAGAATKWKTFSYGFGGAGEAVAESFLGFEDLDKAGEESGQRFGKSFWESVVAAGVGGAAGGGGRGALASVLPLVGAAFGPVGAAVGGFLGNLFGGRGGRAMPIDTRIANGRELASYIADALDIKMLAITKAQRMASGAAGTTRLNSQLSLQAAALGQ